MLSRRGADTVIGKSWTATDPGAKEKSNCANGEARGGAGEWLAGLESTFTSQKKNDGKRWRMKRGLGQLRR